MRLFLALDLPDAIKDDIANLHATALSGANWTTRQQWHITLHFIGEHDADSAIRESLATIKVPSFELHLAAIGQFPEEGKPRILWAGIHAPKALHHLHETTGKALQSSGYKPETRPYKPHLTLARFKQTVPSRNAMQAYFEQHGAFKTETFAITHSTPCEHFVLLPSS
jgi:2'-5' RNA ligase